MIIGVKAQLAFHPNMSGKGPLVTQMEANFDDTTPNMEGGTTATRKKLHMMNEQQ